MVSVEVGSRWSILYRPTSVPLTRLQREMQAATPRISPEAAEQIARNMAAHWASLEDSVFGGVMDAQMQNPQKTPDGVDPVAVPDEWERADLDAFLMRLAEDNYPQPQYLKIRVGRLYALFADLLDYVDADQTNLTYRGVPVELIDDCPDPLEGGLNMPLPL